MGKKMAHVNREGDDKITLFFSSYHGSYSTCLHRCLSSLPFPAAASPHPHVLSLSCRFWWDFRLNCVANALPHADSSHLYGRSPEAHTYISIYCYLFIFVVIVIITIDVVAVVVLNANSSHLFCQFPTNTHIFLLLLLLSS